MRRTKFLIVVVLLVVYIQSATCDNDDKEVNPVDILKSHALVTRERDLRGLRDVWDQVKKSAISSWNFLKNVAERTKNRILQWTESARGYGIKLVKSFEEQLKSLRNRLNNVITDLLGTGKIVQECLKKEGRNIDDALQELLKNMSECVANQIKQLTQLNGRQTQVAVNDSLFMTELDNKLDACETDKNHYEQCLYTVRELVFDEIEDMDTQIQKTHMESRNLADDIKNALASCSLVNLSEVSSFITSEMMEVVRCVLESRGVHAAILE